MARNQGAKKPKGSIPDGYELARDADGNLVLVPSTPDTSPARSPFSRISEGAMEGYGYQPLQGPTEEEYANHPILSTMLDPVQKGLNAVRRFPGAVAGGLAGAAGAGTELWTGDRGSANAAENAARSAMEYFGNKAMAEPGMRPSRNIPKNGELLPPERGAPGQPAQLGYRGPTILDQRVNPSSPIGRGVSGEPIRGGSAEGLPRLTRVDPLTQYWLAGEQGQRIGPNRPSEAMRPEVDQMYSPTGRNEFAPNVSTRSRLTQLGDESPLQADRIGESQAAARARQAHSEFLDELRAADEGMPERGYRSPVAPPDAPPSRPMSAPDVTDAPRSPFLDMPAPGVRGRPPAPAPEPLQLGSSGSASGMLVDPITGHAYQPRQMPSLSQAGSGSFSPVTRAEAVIPQRPVNLEELLGRSRPPEAPLDPVAAAQKAVIDAAAKRVELERQGAGASELRQAAIDEAAARVAAEKATAEQGPMIGSSYKPGWNSNMLTMGGVGAGTAALIAGSQDAQRKNEQVDRMPEGYVPQSVEEFHRMLGRPAPASDAGNGNANVNAMDQSYAPDSDAFQNWAFSQRQRSAAPASSGATSTARAVLSRSPANAPSSTATAPAQESRGFLSGLIGSGGKLFDTDYQKGASSRQLYDAANQDPDNKGAYFRAVQQEKAERDAGSAPQGEKRGGQVEQKPSKEAMLHKSLEIIHHMIRSR